MRIFTILLLAIIATSCAVRLMDKHQIEYPIETSGLAVSIFPDMLNTIEDSDNGPFVYEIYKNGKFAGYSEYTHRINTDWEDMANDTDSYFIGDIGNNLHNRDTLTIYIKSYKGYYFDDMEEIHFICDHTMAPFDFEAMFSAGDSLYLITKRHKGKYTYIFQLPKDAGFYNITPIDSARIRGQITGADYHEDNQLLIMTGYRWYIPFVLVKKNATPSTALCKPLKRRTFLLRPAVQTEAVVIVNPQEIYVSAEGNPLHKPALFKLRIGK